MHLFLCISHTPGQIDYHENRQTSPTGFSGAFLARTLEGLWDLGVSHRLCLLRVHVYMCMRPACGYRHAVLLF